MLRVACLLVTVAMALVLLVWRAPATGCFVAADATPGWKRVPLPEGRRLRAPADVAQLRPDGPLVVWEEVPDAHQGAYESSWGVTTARFALQAPGVTMLQVEFAESLGGARVDITGHFGVASLPIWANRRTSASQLSVEWSRPGLDAVTVTVHHHLRSRPVVTRWWLGHLSSPAAESWIPPDFRAPGGVVFWQPAGRRVELCADNGAPAVIQQQTLLGTPSPTQLLPAPRSVAARLRAWWPRKG
jgi:hypothetical protein